MGFCGGEVVMRRPLKGFIIQRRSGVRKDAKRQPLYCVCVVMQKTSYAYFQMLFISVYMHEPWRWWKSEDNFAGARRWRLYLPSRLFGHRVVFSI